MPDLDFDGLRANLRDSVRQPPVDDVIARARRRSSRRKQIISAAAVVVLALAVVPLVRLGVQRDTATPFGPADQNFVVSLDFYGLTTGYVLGESCEHRPCTAWLMVTTDGMTWEKRTLPPVETGFSGQPDRLVTLGATRILLDDHRPGGPLRRFFSGDGAKTWHEVPVEPISPTTTTIASSTILECRGGKVFALMPANGHTAQLTNQPPFDVTSCETYPDMYKTWWATGVDHATRRPVVAFSTNGETWTTRALPSFTPPRITSTGYPLISVTRSPTAVYATVSNPGDTPADLVAIFRSSDNGETWERTWQAEEGKQPTGSTGKVIAGTDGKLRVSQWPRSGHEVWTSADGGRTFTAEPGRAAADIRQTRTGYVAIRPPTSRFLTSYDGITWRDNELPIP